MPVTANITLAFREGGISLQPNSVTEHGAYFLHSVDVHPLSFKVWNLLRTNSRVLETIGHDEKIRVGLVDSVGEFHVVKTTVNEIKIHPRFLTENSAK